MKLGLLSDVHGNRVALDAIVADASRHEVDAWWVLGDLVAIGPEPITTLEAVAGLPNLTVTRGNTERYVLTRDRPPPHEADVAERPELLGLFAAVEGSFAWTHGARCRARGGWSGSPAFPWKLGRCSRMERGC